MADRADVIEIEDVETARERLDRSCQARRSADRYWFTTDYWNNNLGFWLVSRTLTAKACADNDALGVRQASRAVQ